MDRLDQNPTNQSKVVEGRSESCRAVAKPDGPRLNSAD